jgi:hypothetical protein
MMNLMILVAMDPEVKVSNHTLYEESITDASWSRD